MAANNCRSPLFHLSVDKLLQNWQALQIAVKSGQGGAYGKEIALWMRGAVENFFYENDDLMGVEVGEFLAEIMNNELDTIVDDNSLDELGGGLCLHFRLSRDPSKEQELIELHRQLDAGLLQPMPPVHAVPDSSDEEDEEMETEDCPPVANGQSGSNGASSSSNSAHSSNSNSSVHKVGSNFVTEPDEEGWSTVVKTVKKH